MSSKPLPTQSLLDLMTTCSNGLGSRLPMATDSGFVGCPGGVGLDGRLLTRSCLDRSGLTASATPASYPASLDDDSSCDLTEDDQTDRYATAVPGDFRWKFVPAAEVAVYRVRPAAILNTIADLLVSAGLRKGNAPLLDDSSGIWGARIGPR